MSHSLPRATGFRSNTSKSRASVFEGVGILPYVISLLGFHLTSSPGPQEIQSLDPICDPHFPLLSRIHKEMPWPGLLPTFRNIRRKVWD